MAQTTVTFVISQDGTVTEKVSGVKGNVCESITKVLEDKLGDIILREHTPEYYQSAVVDETIEEFTHDSEGC
mgnify:FL=1|tara:strand:+ start:778 stop:993 length:216 start_codon:yes stop_codon:yes gene_type:complete